MDSNALKDMLNANCSQLFVILAFDGNINLDVKPILYEELNSILDAINAAVTIDGTNFEGFRKRTFKLNNKIEDLKKSHASE
jgi:hypothetical protein